MEKSFWMVFGVVAIMMLISVNVSALTMTQFNVICDSSDTPCSDHPVLQSYVGGALDLLGVLDEETSYLEDIICKDRSTLFDVKKIIRFMQNHQVEYAQKNAMLLLVRYVEEQGGC